jgi:addiction module HigA family antidote
MKKLSPLHPGEVLREEFMVPLNLHASTLADCLNVPRTHIESIAREEMSITADTALRLGAYFHTTPEFWLNLQNRFELDVGVARWK